MTETQSPNALMVIIEKFTLDPNVDVEKMKALLDMQERLVNKRAETDFMQAMGKTQREIEPIVRATWNDHTKSAYVKYEQLEQHIRPIYMANGFVLTFGEEPFNSTDKNMVRLVCDVVHTGGYTKRYYLSGEIDDTGPKGTKNKTSIQGAVSSTSYLRRVLTAMIFNVIMKNEDKDGNKIVQQLSEDQIEYIETLITETSANRQAFLGTYGISKVEDLPANMFRAATSVLEIKKAKMGG